MGTVILDGEPPVTVTLRRSAQARRLSLRVSRLDGRVTLSMPRFASERDARAFLSQKEPWIRSHLSRRAPVQVIAVGARLPFRGRVVEIVSGKGRAARLDGAQLVVPGDGAMVVARVAAFLKLHAREELRAASDKYAALMGVSYARLTLRDTRSRWGSCTSSGNLMYSWRLVMAPPEVLDYVAAHEVAHLLEMNHSSRYWAHVARVCPDYADHRAWLHREGESLHAWQFDAD